MIAVDLPATEQLGGYVLRGLAVVGAAALGFLLTGWLVQVLVKAWFGKAVPRPALMFVRLLGGAFLGIIVGLWLFGPGGPGQGGYGFGLGGGWFGLGGPPGETPAGPTGAEGKGTGSESTRPADTAPRGKTLEIEVLGPARAEGKKVYRFKGEQQRYDLGGVVKEIDRRRRQEPELTKVELLIYDDSPTQDKKDVTELEKEARTLGLIPAPVRLKGQKAP